MNKIIAVLAMCVGALTLTPAAQADDDALSCTINIGSPREYQGATAVRLRAESIWSCNFQPTALSGIEQMYYRTSPAGTWNKWGPEATTTSATKTGSLSVTAPCTNAYFKTYFNFYAFQGSAFWTNANKWSAVIYRDCNLLSEEVPE